MSYELEPVHLEKLAVEEKCGIVGVFGTDNNAAFLAYSCLWTLQHRGQESSGIAASDGETLKVHKGMGLVAQVYRESDIEVLQGCLAIGHNRYSTSRGSTPEHAQPIINSEKTLVLAHNGNLPSTRKLETFLTEKGIDISRRNDSELMAAAIDYFLVQGLSLEEAIVESYPLFTGAFSLVVMSKDTLVAVRDPRGIRPLSLGSWDGGYVFASETCAFDTIGAKFQDDVRPGEMIVINQQGVKRHQIVSGSQRLDIFEFVYFARPDSVLLGQSVNEIRRRFGEQLAWEYPLSVDVVVPVPDSAIPAALGYAQTLNLPFTHGFAKNRYIHRTFITPDQLQRQNGVALKLNPLPNELRGKRVAIIDDSIVRGNTAGPIVSLLRQAGAQEVHFLVSSPPVRYPDFYGIDTPQQAALIGANKSVVEIKEHIGADSLYYLSLEGLIKATGLSEELLSTSCFTGSYPIDIGERVEEIVFFRD